jgi:hypothetical protein
MAHAQAAPADQTTTTTTTTTTTAPTTTTDQSSEEAVVLSPFVVDASEEKGSYKANSTLAGTRVRTDLNDVASALTVVTAQFLQDTGATNTMDLLVYTPNTEVAGLNGNFSGIAGNSTFSENLLTPSTTTRVRGLSAADNTRDYFLTDIPWDAFNVGRVDLQRGPNSILFGVGSPGGIINNDVNDAEFTDTYKVEDRFASFGTVRNSFDFNKVLIPNTLAVRVAWVNDEEKYQQRYAFNDMTRYFAALRYDPEIFGKSNHTSLRVKFEQGHTTSDNPRSIPPTDQLSAWFADGKPIVNSWAQGTYAETGDIVGTNPALGAITQNGSAPAIFGGVPGTIHEGRTYWQDVVSYYNGVGGSPEASGEPTAVFAGGISTALAPTHGIGDFPTEYYLAVAPENNLALGEGIPGASYYANTVLMDSSVFNYFDNLLDGPNKKEWSSWTAVNASLSQTFFNDRLGIEAVYDNQKYVNGQVGFLDGGSYDISVDVNGSYVDGTPNPNAGRPEVAASAESYGNQANVINRNSWRGTVTADIRASDFLSKDSWVTRVLGNHTLTGLLEEDRKNTFYETWSEYATDVNWETDNGYGAADSINNYRQFDWVDYIGPNMLGRSSASGMNLSAVSNIIAPGAQSVVRNFNSTWNAPSSVVGSAPFTYTNYTTGTMVVGSQYDNPANYVGWQETPVNWLNANNPTQFPDLVYGASRSSFSDISQGFTWQGNMLDGTFVPTFGWRKDSVVNYSTNAPTNSNTSFVSTDFGEDPTSRREAIGETKAWGGVFHFPKFLTSWLPWGTTFSVFYDHNQNFEAQAPRISLIGQTLPNPTGKTKEYGFTVTTLNDKVSFKVDWYNTQIAEDTLDNGGGLGGSGYQIWAVPAWGYQYATALQQGFEEQTTNPTAGVVQNYGVWNYGYQDQQSGIAGHSGNTTTTENPSDPDTALTQNIVNAWLNFPLSVQFFNAWGVHPNPINPALAKASGQLVDAYEGTPFNAGAGWYSLEQPGSLNPVTTVDTLSKGEEFELSAQPIRNWNITVNYSRTFATHENIDALTASFMAQLTQFFNGPGGQLRIWGAGGSAIQSNWIENVYNPYLVEVNSQGQSAPEVAPWRLNAITTYQFDRGKLKGYFIGGALRVEAGRIEGYQYSPTLGTLDVTKPWMGPNDTHVDLWFGYSRRIFANKINWRIQANLRNVGESTRLVASQYQPDGSLALERIQEGMTWELTNAFDF